MHRTLASKRDNFFGKEIGGTGSSYDGLKLSSRDLGSDKLDSGLGGGKLGDLDGLGSGGGLSSGIVSGLSGGSTKLSSNNHTSDSMVGYANLPNQVFRKAVKRGFEFNLLVVGESGLGKSTFINSLFLAELYSAEFQGPSKRLKKTVYVEPSTVVLKENGVHLKLTLIDTPGFGDAVDNTNCWQPVVDFIEARFEEFLTAESKVNRTAVADHRVHACLYFVPPNGHGLKPLDIEFMRRIHDKVNVIPVVAKADSLTPEECRDFKKTITNELLQHKIRVYEFPDTEGGLPGIDDETELTKYRRMKERAPFAVIGANTLTEKSVRVRGRVYPWGTVEVDNLEHNDFLALRSLLLRTHMQDLKEVTHTVHYENYRYTKLSGIAQEGHFATKDGKDPMTQMETEKREHETKMKKMEAEMEQVFEQKVKEKMLKLKESETDLQRRAEQMKKQLDQQEQELIDKRKTFDAERVAWEEVNRDFDRRMSMDVSGTGDKLADMKEKSKTEKKKKGLF